MTLLAARAEDERNVEGLLRIRGYLRAGLWLSLLLLTLTLLVFPTRLVLEYHPTQSIPAIPNLPRFAALYITWLLLLLLLLLAGREAPWWEKPALVGIFALVFVGFWLITGPYTGLRYDGMGNAAGVSYLSQQAEGRIPLDNPNLNYFNFPGMHLLAFVLVQVTGLGLFQGVTLALAFHLVLLAVLLYILLLNALNRPSVAALGALLAIQGNIMLARYSFYPGIWALVFLAMFLIFLHRPGQTLFETWQERFLMLLLLGATTITHLVTATALFFTLAGIYLVRNWHLLRTKTGIGLVSASTLATFLVIPLSWDIYWATRIFEGVTKVTSGVIADFTEKGLLVYFFNLGASYAGAEVPLWTVIVRAFWWGALFLFGAILGLRNLLNIKGLSRVQQVETGGLVGVIALSTAVTLLSLGGTEFYRFLLYGGFFTVPIILRFLLGLPRNRRRLAVGLAISLFFVLSFPTFLAHNNLVGISGYYPPELQAGNFLKQTSGGQGDSLTIFNEPSESGVLLFSVPEARLITTPQAPELKGRKDFWQAVDRQAKLFKASGTRTGQGAAFFYLSQRRVATSELFFRAQPHDPEWKELQDTLAETNKVYENGMVQLYASTGNAP
ncbi:MAG: hypothetical protein Q8O86_12915 [Dehalococcoidia bacterium]|nr:hypothetical protein [Dehalococcoidia bacterium]